MAFSRKERVRWVINYVAERDGLSNAKIGKKLGVKGDTINSYRTMATDAKPDFYVRFSETFDIDLIWLLKGTGEPFPGARQQCPEVCGKETFYNKDRAPFVSDHGGLYGRTRRHRIEDDELQVTVFDQSSLPPPPTKPTVREPALLERAGELLRNVIESRDPEIMDAILSNLRVMNEALVSADRLRYLEDENQQLKERIARLEGSVEVYKDRLRKLDDIEALIVRSASSGLLDKDQGVFVAEVFKIVDGNALIARYGAKPPPSQKDDP